MRLYTVSCTVFTMLASLVACGVDNQEAALTAEISTQAAGIYRLTEWTRNETDCSTEGESVLEQEDRDAFVLRFGVFDGRKVLFGTFCYSDELDECRTDAKNITPDPEYVLLDRGSDSEGWQGGGGWAYSIDDDKCGGTASEYSLSASRGTILVEILDIEVDAFLRNTDGLCSISAVQQKATGQACSGLTVLHGTLIEYL